MSSCDSDTTLNEASFPGVFKMHRISEHPKYAVSQAMQKMHLNVANRAANTILREAALLGVSGMTDDLLENNLRWGCSLALQAHLGGSTKHEWYDKVGGISILICKRYSAIAPLTEDQFDIVAPHAITMLLSVFSECYRLLSPISRH